MEFNSERLNLKMDPTSRMMRARREFGEWGGVNPSIEASVTYSVMEASTLPEIFNGSKGPDGGCYLYARSFNPTVKVLSRQLAALEGTEDAYCCASGMAAISCTLLSLCNSGDHIVASNTVYGGTHALLKDFLPSKCAITATSVPIYDLEAVESAIIPNKTKVLFCESVSNPTLVVADIPRLADIAHRHGVTLVVDNTFAPMILSPAALGADVVVHSLTKFISGTSDVIAGCVCASKKFIEGLMDLHLGPLMLLGPVMEPKTASDLLLRLSHLGLRMAEHSKRALCYAQHLENLGAKVSYPGLDSHPQHELIKQMANPGYGFGGLLTIQLDSLSAANAFMERLQHGHSFGIIAVSLGYFDTIMSASATSTSSELSTSELKDAGIAAGLVRMSVGLTGLVEERVKQLVEAYLYVESMPSLRSSPATVPAIGKGASVGAGSSSDDDLSASAIMSIT